MDALPGTPLPFDPIGAVSYLAHSTLQEVVARGFLQTSFQRFLGDKKGWRSVLIGAMVFGIFHLHFGLAAVALTIVTSVIFGAVYLRHGNLAGVIVLHFLVGVAAFNTGLM
jgi:membrane protease YdiL (CAAX protease family)